MLQSLFLELDGGCFLNTLKDVLNFTPKVNFNAGVVAAGEAQIESTVTGNNSKYVTHSKEESLKDQSQVYLPTNNAPSANPSMNALRTAAVASLDEPRTRDRCRAQTIS